MSLPMVRLRDTLTVPPHGWIYTQPETQCAMRGRTKTDLEYTVYQHRKYKQLARTSLPEIGEDIEAQICERLNHDPAFCRAA